MLVLKHYAELISLTKYFLEQEYLPQSTINAQADVHAYFKKRLPSSTPSSSSLAHKPINTTTQPLPLSQHIEAPSLQPVILTSPETKLTVQSSPLSPQAPILSSDSPVHASENKLTSPLSQISSSSITVSNPPKRSPQPPLFIQEALNPSQKTLDRQEIRNFLRTHFPSILLREEPLCDKLGKNLRNKWLHDQEIPPIIILSFNEDERQLKFLNNLAQAISLRLAPARILSVSKMEKEKQWATFLTSQTLRLIIASDYGIYMQSELMKTYREVPQTGKHFINQTPLLLLSDISLYLKEPPLKSLLWRAICNECSAASIPMKNNSLSMKGQ